MSDTVNCRATRLPCCFGCPASVCELVDIRGALDNSDKPPIRRRWWQRWTR